MVGRWLTEQPWRSRRAGASPKKRNGQVLCGVSRQPIATTLRPTLDAVSADALFGGSRLFQGPLPQREAAYPTLVQTAIPRLG